MQTLLDGILFTSCYLPDCNKTADMKDEAQDILNKITNAFPYNDPILLGDFNTLLQLFGSNPLNNNDTTTRLKKFILQNDLQIINNSKDNAYVHRVSHQYYCNDYMLKTQDLNFDQFNIFQAHYDQLITDPIPIYVTLAYRATTKVPNNSHYSIKQISYLIQWTDKITKVRFMKFFSFFDCRLRQLRLIIYFHHELTLEQCNEHFRSSQIKQQQQQTPSDHHYEIYSFEKSKKGVQETAIFASKSQQVVTEAHSTARKLRKHKMKTYWKWKKLQTKGKLLKLIGHQCTMSVKQKDNQSQNKDLNDLNKEPQDSLIGSLENFKLKQHKNQQIVTT